MSGVDKTGKSQEGSDVGAADEAKFQEVSVAQKPVETKRVHTNALVQLLLAGDDMQLYVRSIAGAGKDAVSRVADMLNMATGRGGNILDGAINPGEIMNMAYPESHDFYGKDYGSLDARQQRNIEMHQGFSKKEVEHVAAEAIKDLMEATGESEEEIKIGLSSQSFFLVYPTEENKMTFAFHLHDFSKAAKNAGQSLADAYQIYKGCVATFTEARDNRLDVLDLSGRKISYLPPDMFRYSGGFNGGKILLNDNLLETLPVEIGAKQNLKELNLSHNRLTSLPDTINKLSGTLKDLNLSNNFLKTLPAAFSAFAGKDFHVSLDNNPFVYLPAEVSVILPLIATGLYGPSGHDPDEGEKMRLYFQKFGTLFPTKEQIQSLE